MYYYLMDVTKYKSMLILYNILANTVRTYYTIILFSTFQISLFYY